MLGVQWLQLLGPILMDYQKLTMQFSWENETIQLQGIKQVSQQMSMNQFRKMHHKGTTSSMFQITLLPQETSFTLLSTTQDIDQIIQNFVEVFAEPISLPPHRQFDHEIHLLPNATPVNVRPYRYPHFQKNEIEKQVVEMLN